MDAERLYAAQHRLKICATGDHLRKTSVAGGLCYSRVCGQRSALCPTRRWKATEQLPHSLGTAEEPQAIARTALGLSDKLQQVGRPSGRPTAVDQQVVDSRTCLFELLRQPIAPPFSRHHQHGCVTPVVWLKLLPQSLAVKLRRVKSRLDDALRWYTKGTQRSARSGPR